MENAALYLREEGNVLMHLEVVVEEVFFCTVANIGSSIFCVEPDVTFLEPDRPSRRSRSPCDDREEARLSRPVRTQNREGLSLIKFEVYWGEDREPIDDLGHGANLNLSLGREGFHALEAFGMETLQIRGPCLHNQVSLVLWQLTSPPPELLEQVPGIIRQLGRYQQYQLRTHVCTFRK